MILRRKHELLLVSAGTRFVRLPDVMDGQPSIVDLFAQHVRAEPLKWGASREQIDQLAGGSLGEAARLTHSRLANEAIALVASGPVMCERYARPVAKRPGRELRRKIEWASGVRFSWQDQLERRQRQPAFQQFQIARRAAPPPQYPPIEDAVRNCKGARRKWPTGGLAYFAGGRRIPQGACRRPAQNTIRGCGVHEQRAGQQRVGVY